MLYDGRSDSAICLVSCYIHIQNATRSLLDFEGLTELLGRDEESALMG